jgi:site-specific recombinase XerD
MSKSVFSSCLAKHLSAYVDLRRSLGYEMRSHLFVFRQFDRVATTQIKPRGSVSRKVIEIYIRSLAHLQPITRRLRLSMIRQFLLYLRRFEPATSIPDRSMEPARSSPRKPYIFTEDDICNLIWTAYRYPPRYRCRRWILYPTLFGLLYVTGMRVSEVLGLTLGDIDLRQAVLHIRKAKFHKARLVPLAESSCAARSDS